MFGYVFTFLLWHQCCLSEFKLIMVTRCRNIISCLVLACRIAELDVMSARGIATSHLIAIPCPGSGIASCQERWLRVVTGLTGHPERQTSRKNPRWLPVFPSKMGSESDGIRYQQETRLPLPFVSGRWIHELIQLARAP